MKKILINIGCLMAWVLPKKLFSYLSSIFLYLYTGFYKHEFKKFGENSLIVPKMRSLIGASNISIGNNCIIGKNIQLTAYSHYISGQNFLPSIIIGDGVSIGDNSHITAINSIIIGNNVLTGKNVLISDNAHGSSCLRDI